MVHGTFFPFLWEATRPNLITYNFISTHGQHKRSNSLSTNRYSHRSGQPTVLRVQSPLFGVRLSVPPSRTNSLYNNSPGPLPIDFGNSNALGSIPFGRGGSYDVPFDALLANYFRTPVPESGAQASNFPFRALWNPALPPTRPARPELQPNLIIPPNILIRQQSPPPRTFPPPGRPLNFPIPTNILFGQHPSPPQAFTPPERPQNFPNHPNVLFRQQPSPPEAHSRPERPPNFPVPPDVFFAQQTPPPQTFTPLEGPPNFPNHPNVLFRQQPPPPRKFTPFEIPYPFNFRLL